MHYDRMDLIEWHRGRMIPLDEVAVWTTEGEPWTWRQACELAHLIWVRFGRDNHDACVGWSRLLENNTTEEEFLILVRKGAELAGDTKEFYGGKLRYP